MGLSTREIVVEVERRGGRIVVSGERVGIAPKTAATPELLAAIREHKDEIAKVAQTLAPLASVKVSQFRRPQDHDAECRCSGLKEHYKAGGSFDAWVAAHPDDRDNQVYSFAAIMQSLAKLHGPCGVCRASSWRWDAVGEVYKCCVCHPSAEGRR